MECDLRCVNEIYPFKKGITKWFQKCVEVLHSTFNALIFVIPSWVNAKSSGFKMVEIIIPMNLNKIL